MSFVDRDYRLLAADVKDDEWLRDLPKDRPTAVVLEGVLSYLTPESRDGFLEIICQTLQTGEVYFDCTNSFILNAGRRTLPNASQRLGTDLHSPFDVLSHLQRDLVKVLDVLRFVELPGAQQPPMTKIMTDYVLPWIPVVPDATRVVKLGICKSEH
ncbi:putative Tetracenomycin polyketide synthesis O-methyltransferase TcmP [Seiridium cardinale]